MYSSNPNNYQAPPAPTNTNQAPHGRAATASAPSQFQSNGPSSWSTGLCDCFNDPASCCLTLCCPCITFGRIAEIVDKGSPSCIASGGLYLLLSYFTGLGCMYSCCYRSKMREQYMLPENLCGDCLVHCCCETCALCQEYRELQHRGFDMSIGWEDNMARQNGGLAMPPVIPGGMSK